MLAYNRRSFSGTAPDAVLAASIDDTTLTVTCDDLTGWPDGTGGPFEVTFEPGKSSEEKCWASARSGNTLTLLGRGMEGPATSHAATTTTVRHGFSALDAGEANYAVSQTVGQVTAKGDLLIGSAANTFTKLGVGSTGQSLIVSAGTLAYGAPTVTEADVTGLITDLATLQTNINTKQASPVTAWAKGSLLAGTGAGTSDTVTVGTDGLVLTADAASSGGVKWAAAPGGLLCVVQYGGTQEYVSVSQSVLTALDTTNLRATFTAPPSGRALVRLTGDPDVQNVVWGLLSGSTAKGPAIYPTANSTPSGVVSVPFLITGLSGSVSLDWAAYYAFNLGTAVLQTSPTTPATMEVWAA